MFGERLKELRKRKGFTQEELAVRLGVVRQTVSKWEKGFSVPDAGLLQRLAEILEVEVSELLGGQVQSVSSVNEVAQQLARINEQLAVRNNRWKKVLKWVLIVIAALLALELLLAGLGMAKYDQVQTHQTETAGDLEEP